MKTRVGALTFDFDGYSKFELGGSIGLTRKITKQYEVSAVFSIRHVEVTSASIPVQFLGNTSYFINALGFTQTLDLREDPLVNPRGLVAGNTIDIASNAFGGQIELIRATFRLGYYIPFGPKPLTPGVATDQEAPKNPWQRFWQQSSLAFGARMGSVHSLNHSGPDEPNTIPIDERFFNGGGTTVRSFGERDLDGVLADYSSDAVLFVPGGPLRGHAAIKPFFQALVSEFSKPGATFSMRQQYSEGDYAYILWSAETADNSYEAATDTFIVRNGKIVAQSFAAKITLKG